MEKVVKTETIFIKEEIKEEPVEDEYMYPVDFPVDVKIEHTEEDINLESIRQCHSCNFETKEILVFKEHNLKIHGLKFACSKCEYQAATKHKIDDHKQVIHSGLKLVCCQAYKTKIDFEEHCRVEHGGGETIAIHKPPTMIIPVEKKLYEPPTLKDPVDKPVNITKSKQVKRVTLGLSGHLKIKEETIEDDSGAWRKCHLCGFLTDNLFLFKQHRLNTHRLIFACNKCEYQGETMDLVQNHKLVIHEGVKLDCCKDFNCQMSYTLHLKAKHGGGEQGSANAVPQLADKSRVLAQRNKTKRRKVYSTPLQNEEYRKIMKKEYKQDVSNQSGFNMAYDEKFREQVLAALPTMSHWEVQKKFGIGSSTLSKWAREASKPRAPSPTSLTRKKEALKYFQIHGMSATVSKFGIPKNKVFQWNRELKGNTTEVKTEMRTFYDQETKVEVLKYYKKHGLRPTCDFFNVGHRSIYRWRKELSMDENSDKDANNDKEDSDPDYEIN